MKTKTRIFLSYAREDERKVRDLYERLSQEGFEPWMDEKDILPGERWEESIENGIRRSDFFLVCLSGNSINKRGFLQKEIRIALDVWKGMLDTDIYLIPGRLEICEVPRALRDFQWVDLFEKPGWRRLIEAIREGNERRSLGIDPSVQPITQGIEIEALETLVEVCAPEEATHTQTGGANTLVRDAPRLMIFIDGANLLGRIRDYRRARDSTFQLDPCRLVEFLVRGHAPEAKIRFYDSKPIQRLCTPSGYQERKAFISQFESIPNCTVVLHSLRVYESPTRVAVKGDNPDMSLALDLLSFAKEYDVAMLVSSDSGFSAVVDKLYQMYSDKQIICIVLLWQKRSSQLLHSCEKSGSKYFINLDQSIDEITVRAES